MAEVLLLVSDSALGMHPTGTEWFTWAQQAYAARPGVTVWLGLSGLEQPGPGESTAMDWEYRGNRLLKFRPEAARRCLREAAAAWATLARQRGDWRFRLRAEDCLRAAGEMPADPLPKPDPDAVTCQGPDIAILARTCQVLASADTEEVNQAELRRLLDLLGLTLYEQPFSSDRPSREPRYHGRLGGMLRAQRVWHLGDQALEDLATAFRHSRQPALVELIGALGGTRAAAVLNRLEPELMAMPEAWAGWLDALQQAAPDRLPVWLDQVLPAMKDLDLQSLVRHAGAFVSGQAREHLAAVALQRCHGEDLRQVLAWWISDTDRLRRTDLMSFWYRYRNGESDLYQDLLIGLTASRDPRAGWWLLAVATMQENEPLRVTALRGLAVLAVPEARALCRRILEDSSQVPLQVRIAAAQTAAALGDGDRWRQPARVWLNELEDDPENDQVQDLRCLLLALEPNDEDLAWVQRAAAEPIAWMGGVLVRSLAATRLRSAVAPALQIADAWLNQTGLNPERDRRIRMGILIPALSRLPLDDAQRQEWERTLGQPIPPPLPDPIRVRGSWSLEESD